MNNGRILAVIIGSIGMTQTLRHDLGFGIQGIIGFISIVLLYLGFGGASKKS
jgi:hypothetical protein